MAAPHPPTTARDRRRRTAIAVAVVGLVVAVGGAIGSLAALGQLDDARQDQAVARVTYDNVERIVQARRDDALGQPSLARSSTDDERLDAELDALADARPAARADIDDLRTRERELHAAVRRSGATDERLLSGTLSSLDRVQRSAVRPFGDAVDDAEQRVRRTIVVTAVLGAAAWAGTLVLARERRR